MGKGQVDMMDYPLLLKSVLYRATLVFPEQEIATHTASGMKRYTYLDMAKRAAKLANALDNWGLEQGDSVASFAWNNERHMELYYGVPCSGRVLHTVNIRLSPEQIAYTINHAEDKVVFVDEDLAPLFLALAPHLKTVERFVILTDATTVEVNLPNAISYEALIQGESSDYVYPNLDEHSPAIIAYTSATTGDPKGVVYSHRGLYLHCLTCMTSHIATTDQDVSMPIVPMFHVNAWGRPYADLWAGAKVVLPGARFTSEILADLINDERVTFAAGVPTIWMGVLQHVLEHRQKYDFSSVRVLMSGGSALPLALTKAYQEELGVTLLQGYGQTETTPVTFMGIIKHKFDQVDGDDLYNIRTKAGLIVPGLELRLVDGQGNDVPFDGESRGELLLRGPWIISEYYKNPAATASAFVDGWFRTGDIASLNADGYLQIVDRTKDLIKSGGEWISSVDLENTLMSHPDVLEAAVIGIPDLKWQERPLACVVLKAEARQRVNEVVLTEFLESRVAKFWIPDSFVVLDEIPKTTVGKFSKRTLREMYHAGSLTTATSQT